MSYKIEIYSGSAFVDVSDNVNDVGLIPYIERNRNHELAAEGFHLSVSMKCAIVPEQDARVIVTKNDAVFYSGYISEITENYDSKTYQMQVDSNVKILQDHYLTYSVLHTTLVSEAANEDDYNSSDTSDYPTINFLFLLRAIFTKAGLTLTTTGMEDRIVGEFTSYALEFFLDDFLIDESVLYSLNQDNASEYAASNPSYDDPGANITLFDFVKQAFGIFGLYVIATDDLTYSLKHFSDGRIYTITSLKKSYITQDFPALNNSAILNWYFYNGRDGYHGASSAALSLILTYGRGDAVIPMLNNLHFLYRDIRTVGSITSATVAGLTTTINFSTSTGFAPVDGEVVYISGGNIPLMEGYFQILNSAGSTFDVITGAWGGVYTGGATCRFAGEPLAGYNYWDITDLGGGANPVGIQHYFDALASDYREEKITVYPAEFTIRGVIRNYINITNDTSEIIQETIL